MENEEVVLNFMELTNVPIEDAQRYLSAAGNILEVAIQNYYDAQQENFPQVAEEPPAANDDEADDVRPILPREYSQLIEEENTRSVHLNRVKRQFSSSFRDLKKETEIQENLASGIIPKRKCLEDIYRNPIDITCNVDLHTAKLLGQKQGKWVALLINDENFKSLSFNRDIFNNETDKVKQLIKKNFIFLRKNSISDESVRILHNYNLVQEAIPVFLIIDSLTGELKKNFGDTKDLTLKSVVRELKKFTSTDDKQLKYSSDGIVDSEDDAMFTGSHFHASSSTITATSTAKCPPQKPAKAAKSDSEDSFASISSDEIATSDIDEPKILDSDDELLVPETEKQTNIMLRLQDVSHNFKYPSNRTVRHLINYIYRNYLVQTGVYDDKRNRFALFSKVHNKCITALDQTQNLEQSNIHPSCVLMHNTISKE